MVMDLLAFERRDMHWSFSGINFPHACLSILANPFSPKAPYKGGSLADIYQNIPSCEGLFVLGFDYDLDQQVEYYVNKSVERTEMKTI